jgi:hypothetical protein
VTFNIQRKDGEVREDKRTRVTSSNILLTHLQHQGTGMMGRRMTRKVLVGMPGVPASPERMLRLEHVCIALLIRTFNHQPQGLASV